MAMAIENITMHTNKDCLVVPIQYELSPETVDYLKNKILTTIKTTHVNGVLIDISGMDIIDSSIVCFLTETTQATYLLGVHTVITGFKPGSVSSILDLGLDLESLHTSITLEKGFQLIDELRTNRFSDVINNAIS